LALHCFVAVLVEEVFVTTVPYLALSSG